jgi:hypothetical protein
MIGTILQKNISEETKNCGSEILKEAYNLFEQSSKKHKFEDSIFEDLNNQSTRNVDT